MRQRDVAAHGEEARRTLNADRHGLRSAATTALRKLTTKAIEQLKARAEISNAGIGCGQSS